MSLVLQAELEHARRGTAFFAHTLDQLDDAELDGASLLGGWTRRHVVAHIAYNARAMVRLAEWARTGVETPMYESVAVRNAEIEDGATLSSAALRTFFVESAAQLDEAWTTLSADAWAHLVKTIQGREIPASDTVWMRARELWVHAVDLATSASFTDAPTEVLDRLLGDVVGAWTSRGEDTSLTLEVSDTLPVLQLGDAENPGSQVVSGTRVALAEWATGRSSGSGSLSATRGEVPPAPRWL